MMHPKKKKPMYEMGGKAADMIMKMMKGGMMPKYPGGGMMPRKRGMMYENGGEFDPEDPGFQEFLKTVGGRYYPERSGGSMNFSELSKVLRQGMNSDEMALNPENIDFDYAGMDKRVAASELPAGFKRPSGGPRIKYEDFPTFREVAQAAADRYANNRDLERRYQEYLAKQSTPQRVGPRESVEYTPSGQLTEAERALRRSMGL